MTESRTTALAEGLIAIAAAEGDLDAVIEELQALADAVDSDDQLRATLADSKLPADRRASIVEDLLSERASATASVLASTIVALGRGGDLPAIVSEVGRVVAAGKGAVVAEARSAVPLTDEQIARLADALSAKLDRTVTVRNIVDESVVGGVVTQIGDEVIDGTVRSRLNQLREAF